MRIGKWPLIGGGAAVLVAAAVVVALVISNANGAQPSPETQTPQATRPETPTPSPTPTPVAMPESVPMHGDIAAWSQAPMTRVARVIPQVGDAASGTVAAYVDAPVVDRAGVALEVPVDVEAGTTYEFSAQVRMLTALPAAAAAFIKIGESRIELPPLSAEWTTVTGQYVAPAGATSVPLKIVLEGPVSGLGVDDVSLVATGTDTNIVPNPSFESIGTVDRILNRSLILPASHPALAVRLAEGPATWEAKDGRDDVVATGAGYIGGKFDLMELDGLEQGYYTVTVKDDEGTSVSTTLGVVDYEGASVAADQRFGVGLHVENDTYVDAADLTSSLGLGLARNDILWRFNETTRGTYDFADHYTDSFARLHAHGIHLLGIVNYGNELYGSGLTPETPEAIAAYGRYAAAIAERFDLVGLEVFNEFNQERFNRTACGTNPKCYVPLLESVRSEVRKVDADLPLIAGATARYDADWFVGLWQAGGLSYADAVSFHPYEVSSRPDSIAEVVATANQSMKTHAGDTRPIWITELGSSSKTGGRTIQGQADYLVRTAITSLASGVEKYFWYDLINDSPDPAVHEGNFGMFYQKKDGVAALQPKPVGYAQALMISQLGGRAYLDSEKLAEGVTAHRFGTEEDSTRVVWSSAGTTEVSIRSDGPLTFTNMGGSSRVIEPTGGVVKVKIGPRPLFVSNAPAPASTPPGSETPTP